MSKEQIRPRGQFPLNIEPDVVQAAEEIIKEHARTYEQRMYEDIVKVYNRISLVGSVIAATALGVYFGFQAVNNPPERSAPVLPPPQVKDGEMPSIRAASELYCASAATATTDPRAYPDCVDERMNRIGEEDLYTSPKYFATAVPKPVTLPRPSQTQKK
jgi:hypothetical protein